MISKAVIFAAGLFAVAEGTKYQAFVSLNGQVDIEAGNEFEVTVNPKGNVWTEGWPEATHMMFGLWNYMFNDYMCFLTDAIPLKNGTQKLTIPPDVGPSGAYYGIKADGYSSDEYNSSSGFAPLSFGYGVRAVVDNDTYDEQFFLIGGKGSFFAGQDFDPDEKDPGPFNKDDIPSANYGLTGRGRQAYIPCTSYTCARKCAEKQYPFMNWERWTNGSIWRDCAEDCKDVRFFDAAINIETYHPDNVTAKKEEDPELPAVRGMDQLHCDPNEEIDDKEGTGGETPCGPSCCSRGQFCDFKQRCVGIEHWRSRNNKPSRAAERFDMGQSRWLSIAGLVAAFVVTL